MAKKSKTQRAKASEARQQRKAAREAEELVPQEEIVKAEEAKPEKHGVLKYFLSKDPGEGKSKKAEDKPKKQRFKFLRDVKAEMKRVTWPTRNDVIRWSGVVVVALIFFGVFVALLDNAIITPLLFLISGIGA